MVFFFKSTFTGFGDIKKSVTFSSEQHTLDFPPFLFVLLFKKAII